MKFIFKSLFLILFSFVLLYSQIKQPTKEVRAIWITTVSNSNWPSSANSGELAQKNEAIRFLDAMKSNNFNTAVLQVRGRGALLYPSAIEPWAQCLTGTVGRDPGWDPLQFWIEECHKRGIELHAWWNFASVAVTLTPPQSEGIPHIGVTHPEWVKPVASDNEEGMFMDVGYPEARDYLVNTAMEMVNKYDIDAIHFDFIRYHESVTPTTLWWDSTSYQLHNGGETDRVEWRRENINKFVRAIYDSIKAVKPYVKVGSAPIGVYAKGVPSGVNISFNGLTVYCDSRRWLREGKHDYLIPQVYWTLDNARTPFRAILHDWMGATYGRHVYAGINASTAYNQITAIVDTTRSLQSPGQCFFSYNAISRNNYASIKNSYQYPANIPAMPWIDSIPPTTPQNLKITQIDDKTWQLTWDKAEPGTDGDVAKYYNVYRSIWTVTDYEDGANLYHITTNDDNSYTVSFDEPPTKNYYFSVTALDKSNVESAPSNVVSIRVTDVDDLEKTR